jgi:23S rRNA (uracil1939-C5)-methyltransferase
VIDWFCGLGNFTLPLATRAGEVLGIEGSDTLVARSRENYARQRGPRAALAPTQFRGAQPVRDDAAACWWPTAAPTAGWWTRRAKALSRCQGAGRPAPGQGLARRLDAAQAHRLRELQPGDAGARCRAAGAPGGLSLHAAGVVNMFPHTAHVESIAVFELQ